MIDTRSIRSLDDVGRVMIPRDIRRLVGWQPTRWWSLRRTARS